MSFSSFFPLCYSNNIVLETGDKYSLNKDGSELVIKDVKKVDEGDYTCIAKNKAGEKAEEVSLSVFGKRITMFAFNTTKCTVALFLPLWPAPLLTFAVHFSTAIPVSVCRFTQREAYILKKSMSYWKLIKPTPRTSKDITLEFLFARKFAPVFHKNVHAAPLYIKGVWNRSSNEACIYALLS